MSEAKQKLAIITGATSVIGDAIQRELSVNGFDLATLSRTQNLSINALNLNLSSELSAQKDFTKLESQSKEYRQKLLVHCAPIWLLPEHIAAFHSIGIKRIIAFSSTSIEGKSSSSSAKELATINKLQQAEDLSRERCSELNIDLTLFRPTMIYGYGKGENIALIARMISKLRFFPVALNAQGLRRPVHVDDLAQAVSLAAFESKAFGNTYNLSGGEELTYIEMVKRIIKASNTKAFTIPLPTFLYRFCLASIAKLSALSGKAMDIDPAMVNRMSEDLNFDSSKAKRDFNYSPNTFLPNGKNDILARQRKQ